MLTAENDKLIHSDFKKLTKKLMRSQIINDGKRVDGRDLDEVRKISAAAGILLKEFTVQLYFKGFNKYYLQLLELQVMRKKWMISIQVLKRLIYITITSLLFQWVRLDQ